MALTAAPVTLELAGRPVPTWAYNGSVPGPEVRVAAGEVLRVRLANRLPEATTIHWHGVALRNDMDGVPGVTQPPVQPGGQLHLRVRRARPRHLLLPPPRGGPA